MTMRALEDMIAHAHTSMILLSKDKSRGPIPAHIEEVHYILSSPWVLSQARSVHVTFEKDTVVSEEKVRSLLSAERTKIQDIHKDMLSVIEEKVFDVKLNGYSVEEWQGRTTQSLELSYAITVSNNDTVRKLEESCDRIVKKDRVYFHSSLLLQFMGLSKASLKHNHDHLLIHVHGELTDVVIVEKGACVFFGSYPMGVNTIVRKVAAARHIDYHTADSLMALYLGNKLTEEENSEMERLMRDMSMAWTSEFNKLMKNNPIPYELPRYIVIAARTHEEFFKTAWKNTYQNHDVELLTVNAFANQIQYDKQTYHPRLVSLYAVGLCDII